MSMMSFNTDHLDKKLDNLSLVEPENPQSSSKNSTKSSTSNNILAGTTINNNNISSQYIQKPKTSLLSSSLAGEKQYRMEQRLGMNTNTNNVSNNKIAFFSVDESNKGIEKKFTDEHPEPELLASSVGKEMDGRLIPSSSTISLLSLNSRSNELETNAIPNNLQNSYLTSPKPLNNNQHSILNQTGTVMDRKNSYSNIRSRNSITHLNQKRLQPYQKFTSPPPSQLNVQQDFIYHSTSQSIPINNRTSANVPDSPNLDPTSLGGSPSRFWLSSQTPPRSLANSLNRNSRTHLYQIPQQPQVSQPIHIPAQDNYTNNYTTATKRDGNSSPILNPVQTPSEDPPMTPLYLNLNSLNQNESYFGDLSRYERRSSQIEEEDSEDGDDYVMSVDRQ